MPTHGVRTCIHMCGGKKTALIPWPVFAEVVKASGYTYFLPSHGYSAEVNMWTQETHEWLTRHANGQQFACGSQFITIAARSAPKRAWEAMKSTGMRWVKRKCMYSKVR